MKLRYGSFAGTCLAALLAFPPSVRSAGINLSWNECGESGSPNQSFDCSSTSGAPFKLVGSFIPPAGIGEFLGLSSELQIYSQQPALQDWWKHGSGQCRGTGGLSVSFDFTQGFSNCTDVYGGVGAGGLAYDVGFASPSSARLRIQGAIPIDNRLSLENGVEYYAYTLQIARASGGAGCGGCSGVACISVVSIQLFQPPEAGFDPEITHAASRAYASWQGSPATPCSGANGATSRTWGQVKSLYR